MLWNGCKGLYVCYWHPRIHRDGIGAARHKLPPLEKIRVKSSTIT